MSKQTKIRIIIADDHPLFRSGTRAELEKIPDVTVLAEAGDGETALELIQNHQPDIAVLDVRMPKLTGLDVAENLLGADCPTKVILLTMHRERKLFLKALELGVRGYLLKDALVNEIKQAVIGVAEGQYFLSPELSGMLMEKVSQRNRQKTALDWQKKLTPSELNIVQLISDLKSNQEIAAELFISKRTVENHRVNISRKLELKGTNALLKFAVKNKGELY